MPQITGMPQPESANHAIFLTSGTLTLMPASLAQPLIPTIPTKEDAFVQLQPYT